MDQIDFPRIQRTTGNKAVLDVMSAVTEHPMHTSVGFDPIAIDFCVFHTIGAGTESIMLKYNGVHRLIKAAFYPAFDFTKTKFNRPRPSEPEVRMTKDEYFAMLSGLPQARGKEAGLLFAKTVEDCQFFASDAVDRMTASKDVLYRAFMKFVTDNDYVLLKSEMILVDPLLGYATWVDLVVSKGDQVFFVEIKTGYGNGAFLSGTGQMQKVAGRLFRNDCRRNQAMLQALLPVLTTARLSKACVLPLVWHVEPTGVTEYTFEWRMDSLAERVKLHGIMVQDIHEVSEETNNPSLKPPITRVEKATKRQKLM